MLEALGMHVVGISRRGSRADAERSAYFDTGRQLEPAPTEHRSAAELREVLARTDFLVVAPDSLWWEHPRVVITPHVAGLAPRYHEQVLEQVSTNLARWRDGLELLNRVDRATGY